ncbi:MAG: hypothetical protein IJG13_16855 [Kiritimatiellae bacterium]|nr:hypothetical protein [Kiritimatiellia bacterium]
MALTDFERRIRRDEGNIRRERRFADYQEGLQGQLDRQGAARMSARERRLAENAQIARGDPGRFSSFERNALLGMQHTKSGDIALQDRRERRGLQDFEMARLRQQGENDFRVAEQKRFGMAEQGVKAAGWGFKGEEVKAEAGLKQAEIDAATKRYGFDKDLEAKKYGADRAADGTKAQPGYFDEKGVYHPGGNVAAEKEHGETAVKVEKIRGKATVGAAAAQAEAQRLREQERQNAMLERELVGQDEAQKKNIMAEANNLVLSAAKNNETLSLDAAVDQVLEARAKAGGQQQGGQAPKEGQTRKLSSGKTAVFRNGKWQLAE